MNLRILRESLVRDRCLGCGKSPELTPAALWCCVLNEVAERIFNLCPTCSGTLAKAYMKQLAQQQAGTNRPKLGLPLIQYQSHRR